MGMIVVINSPVKPSRGEFTKVNRAASQETEQGICVVVALQNPVERPILRR